MGDRLFKVVKNPCGDRLLDDGFLALAGNNQGGDRLVLGADPIDKIDAGTHWQAVIGKDDGNIGDADLKAQVKGFLGGFRRQDIKSGQFQAGFKEGAEIGIVLDNQNSWLSRGKLAHKQS